MDMELDFGAILNHGDEVEVEPDDGVTDDNNAMMIPIATAGRADYKEPLVNAELKDILSTDEDENVDIMGLSVQGSSSFCGTITDRNTDTETLTEAKERELYRMLKSNKNEVKQAVSSDSGKRLDFLIKQAEIFSHFMRPSIAKAHGNSAVGESEEAVKPEPVVKKKRGATSKVQANFYSTAKKSNDDGRSTTITQFDSTPDYMQNGTLRDYQVHGLNWLISLYENGINGILADEMGLGKTIQTIALLGYLTNYQATKMKGFRHLVVVPKSTVSNWMKEFQKWCPDIYVVCLLGPKEERTEFIRNVLIRRPWTICVTTYDMVLREITVLSKFGWGYIVVDEGHRMKNENSLLSHHLRRLSSRNRLLITGTPIQNNIHELWALLNFILPDVFTSSEDFDSWFDTTTCIGDQTIVDRLHSVLRPFWLRRIKSEVEKDIPDKIEYKVFVELTPMQLLWYRKTLLKQLPDLISMGGNGLPAMNRLSALMMNLRKVTNHPYLFNGAEPLPFINGPHIIENSAKMIVLDKLLVKLMAQGSKILLFTQFTSMLDIIEDYLFLKKWSYYRLDGKTDHEIRQESIEVFNDPGNSTKIFLLSTRAGGLGINLTAADSVIIYDSDWNPQMDIQAIDRCHRIGQTKQVHIYRLIVQDTIDERIVERAEAKRQLDHIVIQLGRHYDADGPGSVVKKREQLYQMIQADAVKLDQIDPSSGSAKEDIDTLLQKSKLRAEELEKAAEKESLETLEGLGLLDGERKIRLSKVTEEIAVAKATQGFAPTVLTQFEGQDYKELRLEQEKLAKLEIKTGQRREARVSKRKNPYSNAFDAVGSPAKSQSQPKRTRLTPRKTLVSQVQEFDLTVTDEE